MIQRNENLSPNSIIQFNEQNIQSRNGSSFADLDPFGCISRIKNDKTGVVYKDINKVSPGKIIFHAVPSKKVIIINNDGEITKEVGLNSSLYNIYRPVKKTADGNFTCILTETNNYFNRSIACISDTGDIVWQTNHHWFTHDFNLDLDHKKIWSIVREERSLKLGKKNIIISNNVIIELDLQGKIIWKWSLLDNLDAFECSSIIKEAIFYLGYDNPFHINSIQYVDDEFIRSIYSEPVLVISSRNMNTVFLVGRNSGKIKFELHGETIGQHHATLSNKGALDRNIIIYDNGYNHIPLQGSRNYSRIIEVNIKNKKIEWEYCSKRDQPTFFSPIVGSQQRLSNGNTLITEGYYGRIFEIDLQGNIVWDYTYPDTLNICNHIKSVSQTGLRQIYRAYRFE